MGTLIAAALAFGAFATASSAEIQAMFVPFLKPTVAQVPDKTKQSISVFRETEPVTVPPVVNLYGEVDPATGQSLLGMNAALARPAYPFADAAKRPYFWLVPSADNYVSAIEFDSKGREVETGGINVKINARFAKYGQVEWSSPTPGSKQQTEIRGVVPDSIKNFKLITKRLGKKSLTKTYKVRDNAILVDAKNPTYIVLGGRKFKIAVELGAPDEGSQFDGSYFD